MSHEQFYKTVQQQEEYEADQEEMRQAYDINDPKHPDWAERMAEMADMKRKEKLENGQ